MRYAGTDRDDEHGPWFRLGQLDVTSTVFVLVVWAATLIVFIVEPVDKPVMGLLALIPEDVTSGELWRIVTWPWSHTGFGLWDIIGAALFFIFGTELERQIGRRPFAKLLGSSILIIALAGTVLSALLPGQAVIADLDLLGLAVLLLYIAEHPTRPFFFGIPAWVIGAVIVALEVVNDLAYREWIRLLTVIVAAALITLVARKLGLLTMYDRVPDVRLPWRRDDAPAKPRGRTKGSGGGKKRFGKDRSGPAEIVPMPPRARPARATIPDDISADDLLLDALLDKIAEGGLDALSAQERQSLEELRARRRKPTPGEPSP